MEGHMWKLMRKKVKDVAGGIWVGEGRESVLDLADAVV
jgi:hypothetical protein